MNEYQVLSLNAVAVAEAEAVEKPLQNAATFAWCCQDSSVRHQSEKVTPQSRSVQPQFIVLYTSSEGWRGRTDGSTSD